MAITTACSPLYDRFFPANAVTPVLTPWADFASSPKTPVDFSLSTPRQSRLNLTVTHVALALFAVGKLFGAPLLTPLACLLAGYTLLRFVVQRLIMIPLYPLQSRLVGLFVPALSSRALAKARSELISFYRDYTDFVVREVALEREGVRYSALLIGKPETLNNGNWALQATGNAEAVEYVPVDLIAHYSQLGYNLLLLNGPGIGANEGRADPKSMGEVQELGISFLESAVKARRIVIAGRSLGGAAISEAILSHEFRQDIRYLVVRQVTFGKVSTVAKSIITETAKQFEGVEGRLAFCVSWVLLRLASHIEKVLRWAQCEIDLVAASRKLQELGIKEVVVQASKTRLEPGKIPELANFASDKVIPAEASLGYALVKEGITQNKVFHCLGKVDHMTHKAILAARPDIEAL